MERLRNSDPVGFWKVPPEVWADEEAMDEFAEGLANHMSEVVRWHGSGAGDRGEPGQLNDDLVGGSGPVLTKRLRENA